MVRTFASHKVGPGFLTRPGTLVIFLAENGEFFRLKVHVTSADFLITRGPRYDDLDKFFMYKYCVISIG